MAKKESIFYHYKNVHGAVVVTGAIGTRQYYYYTVKEALKKYKEEWYQKQGQFECQKG